MHCHSCQKEILLSDKPGFRDECPHCNADVHVCHNCKFYDVSAYNECHESSADRVLEKERANFCEYFSLRQKESSEKINPADEAKRKLEEMFKK